MHTSKPYLFMLSEVLCERVIPSHTLAPHSQPLVRLESTAPAATRYRAVYVGRSRFLPNPLARLVHRLVGVCQHLLEVPDGLPVYRRGVEAAAAAADLGHELMQVLENGLIELSVLPLSLRFHPIGS